MVGTGERSVARLDELMKVLASLRRSGVMTENIIDFGLC
jgi:hypothetical protein